jgi:hypothetical protein
MLHLRINRIFGSLFALIQRIVGSLLALVDN